MKGADFRIWSRSVRAMARLFGCSVFCLAALSMVSCKKKEEAAAPPPPTVVTTQVTARTTPVTFEYVAQTQSSQEVSIHARVSGFLERRTYTEGSIVRAGQVLFVMDKKPFEAQVKAAEAALARQKAAMETARLNLQRIKPLTEKNALSKKDLDDAIGTYQAAAAAVEQAKAQLDTQRLNLSYCTITSPVTGITGAAMQQDGTYLNEQNSQLTTVAVLSPIWITFSISENELKKYRDQMARGEIIPPKNSRYVVEVVLVDGSIFPYTGRITYAAPSYDAKTGTYFLRASVPNPKGLLRPNQYVRVRLKGAVRPGAILVPQRAVQQGAKGHFVWVVNGQSKAELRPVVVGDLSDSDWFITEGLRPGDRVVVDGGLTLRPDMVVKVSAPQPGQGQPGQGQPGQARQGQ